MTAHEPSALPLRFGYGTNGLTDLRLDDALGLLADLGYDGVGLTLDHMHLDPLAPDLAARTRHVARRLDELGLGVTDGRCCWSPSCAPTARSRCW
ncbi:hypothetical protein SALBM217S_10453 [Streptomyces griseoloalbus]